MEHRIIMDWKDRAYNYRRQNLVAQKGEFFLKETGCVGNEQIETYLSISKKQAKELRDIAKYPDNRYFEKCKYLHVSQYMNITFSEFLKNERGL